MVQKVIYREVILLETLMKMYNHLHWANECILKTLKNTDDVNQAKLLFSHILLTENLWFTRIKGIDDPPPSIWSEISLEDCSRFVLQNNKNFTTLLSELSTNNIDNIIFYKNSKGKEFSTAVRDILTHIALHGHYHRGQINQQLRISGNEPVDTDFITFIR